MNGKVKAHPKEKAAITKVAIIGEDYEELLIIVVKKDIDHLNVRILARRLVAIKIL